MARLLTGMAALCALGAWGFFASDEAAADCQYYEGPLVATFYTDAQGLPQQKIAEWTQQCDGNYRYQRVVNVSGPTYLDMIRDVTASQWIVNSSYSSSDQQCPAAQTIALEAGHQYQMWVDYALGNPPTADVTYARLDLRYICTGQ